MSAENSEKAAKPETFSFQTETRQLLDLMIHSVYSHKEIFLRELISNASDALDKLRFEALTRPELTTFAADPHIRIEPDPKAHTLTISDTGIGMSRDEIIQYIGTIAKSGSAEYLKRLKEARESNTPPELIGQFGVGFYSSFMVADRVTLVTRRAGEETAWRWESEGGGGYTLTPTERSKPGTSVTLYLRPVEEPQKPDAGEPTGDLPHGLSAAGEDDYTSEWKLRSIIRKYSDFVAYPIRMRIERKEIERDEDGKPKPGAEEKIVVEDQTLNSMKAIWTRSESETTEEEYSEFYKHISHDWNAPLKRIAMKAEGAAEFRALLFIPAKAPLAFMTPDFGQGVQLYIRRVFIMHDCKELIPPYLRFVQGVVDSEDLSLNLSRELLQKNRQIAQIRTSLTRKVLETLRTMLTGERDKYSEFWTELGRIVKEGLLDDHSRRESILDACLFDSTHEGGSRVTLEEYISRMKPGQDAIYYLTGQSRRALETSPHLEALRAKGIEALLLTDPVDELWTPIVLEYKGKRIQSALKGEIEIGSDEERKKAAEERDAREQSAKPFLEFLQKRLEDRIKEVRFSTRLTSSPACLAGDAYDTSPHLERMLKAAGREVAPVKRILEVNPEHAAVVKMRALQEKDSSDKRLEDFAELLYDQAILAEGGQVADPSAFVRRVTDLMVRALEGAN